MTARLKQARQLVDDIKRILARGGTASDEVSLEAVLTAEVAFDGVRAAERQRCARKAEDWARYYPEKVFPADGTSKECAAADMARHTCKQIAREMRDDDDRVGPDIHIDGQRLLAAMLKPEEQESERRRPLSYSHCPQLQLGEAVYRCRVCRRWRVVDIKPGERVLDLVACIQCPPGSALADLMAKRPWSGSARIDGDSTSIQADSPPIGGQSGGDSVKKPLFRVEYMCIRCGAGLERHTEQLLMDREKTDSGLPSFELFLYCRAYGCKGRMVVVSPDHWVETWVYDATDTAVRPLHKPVDFAVYACSQRHGSQARVIHGEQAVEVTRTCVHLDCKERARLTSFTSHGRIVATAKFED